MKNLILKGVHGTCISAAKSIIKNGFKSAPAGRAGNGAYFWAYASNSSQARELARDWHGDKLSNGDYAVFQEKGYAALDVEIEVNALSFINLNRTIHQEKLFDMYARLKSKLSNSEVFDLYIELLSKELDKPILVAEAMLAFPWSTKRKHNGPLLTPGANAYIVLPIGLSSIKVIDVWPPRISEQS